MYFHDYFRRSMDFVCYKTNKFQFVYFQPAAFWTVAHWVNWLSLNVYFWINCHVIVWWCNEFSGIWSNSINWSLISEGEIRCEWRWTKEKILSIIKTAAGYTQIDSINEFQFSELGLIDFQVKNRFFAALPRLILWNILSISFPLNLSHSPIQNRNSSESKTCWFKLWVQVKWLQFEFLTAWKTTWFGSS